MGYRQDNSIISALRFSSREKTPLILQSEAAECGLACIAMIAGYFGRCEDLVSLRHQFSISMKGATLKQIMDISDALGMAARPLRVELETLAKIQCPCILHWDLNHFVVLQSVSDKILTIYDPAEGKKKVTYDDASPHFTGVALELTPTADFEKKENKERIQIKDLWGKVTGLKRGLMQVIALSFVMQIFALALPFYSQLVVDEAVTKGDSDFLHVLFLGFSLLLIVEILVSSLRSYINLYINNMLSIQMEANLFRHLLKLPIAWFEKRHIGDVVSRFESLEPVKKIITGGFIAAIIDGAMALTTLTMMMLYSIKLTVVMIVGVGIYFLGRFFVFPYVRQKKAEIINSKAKLDSVFLETVRAARAVKLFCKERDRQARWQNAFVEVVNKDVQLERLEIKASAGERFLLNGLRLLIIYIAALMVISGQFTVGMLFAFLAYQAHFTNASQGLIKNIIEWKMVGLHLERLSDIAYADKEFTPTISDVNGKDLQGAIELKNISFRYADHEPYIFENVNLVIEPNECIVITGESGCGKTTLLKVMLGLLPPSGGEILIDGQPLNKFGTAAFRRQVGIVMQDDQLLSGSLVENISFFDPKINFDLVKAASVAACIHDDIMAMPMQYQSLVGDMGSSLSGGQKQRILLARALYHRPRVLFLDEGTANLDARTEAEVNKFFTHYKATRVLVAHRPGMVRIADKVVLMQDREIRIGDRNKVSQSMDSYIDSAALYKRA